ncbi:GNAT family N-acetyltransferase [Chelativorans sp. AA-79]|uniref:GNAT family N-acetyltransferase n=1 Tax=Chelativorans sp. AA-79 TaxID=3028735 RepID=UPI0023F912C1|nr:GNAT family N-acetyltransferase [Chelativorans sp. AA-79]WEX07612.1 GNAT family N-acetyltransferase [Chelativorans sp. AA-79]
MTLRESPTGYNAVQLVEPRIEHLPGCVAALESGRSPANIRGGGVAREQLEKIRRDAAAFVETLDDVEAKGNPVKLPDGSQVPRLPGYHRWMWDGAFCGSIGFRWQEGASELPPHVPGHVGYAVVPWKRGRGYARQALQMLLPDIKARGLAFIEITTDANNIPSQRVVTACGGQFVERFLKPDMYGGAEAFRYRIELTA